MLLVLSLNGLAAIIAATAGVLEGSTSSRGCEASFVRAVVTVVGQQDAWRHYY
jgi:hypothetical protein